MVENRSIQELYVNDNSIGDEGVAAIAEVLSNYRINELHAEGCGITLTGARLLAAALSSNHTTMIRVLGLQDNPITIEGALLIVKSAVNILACQHVWIDHAYKRNEEVKKMMTILQNRRWQMVRNCQLADACLYISLKLIAS